MERIAAAAVVDTRVIFSCPIKRDRTLSRLRTILCTTTWNATAQVESSENWNLAAIFRGDGESNLSHDSYFGSSSLDGAVTGFLAPRLGYPRNQLGTQNVPSFC